MSSKKIRVGVAGLRRGMNISQVVHNHDDAHITTVFDPNTSRANAAAESFGARSCASFEEMLSTDIDAVIVATPPVHHARLSCLAAEHGKHVLSEIPAVLTLEEAELLKNTVEQTGIVYMIAENVCYFSNIRTMHALVKEGKLGRIYYAEGEYVHDCRSLFTNRDDGLGDGGGVAGKPSWRAALPPIRYCTHELGPLLMMTADPICGVASMDTGSHNVRSFGAVDMAVALFRTRSGAVVKFLAGFSVIREPAFHFLSLYGTAGSAETDRYRPYENIKAYFDDIPFTRDLIDIPVSLNQPKAPREATAGGHGTSEFYMVDDFLRRIRGNLLDGPFGVSEALNMSVPGICADISSERGGELVEVPIY